MANFLLVIDPQATRRSAFVAQTAGELAFLTGLDRNGCDHPQFSVRWAAVAGAPISRVTRLDGGMTLVLGEPQDGSGLPLDAVALGRAYADDFHRAPECNGFYAAVHFDPVHGWRIEADVLGIFPIYYWRRDDVLLVGSSPALFRRHPLFSTEVDLRGAAALLLTSGIISGHTLLRGVRRLGPDHVLWFHPTRGARELPPAPLARSDVPAEIGEAVDAAAALHRRFLAGGLARSRRPGLLLSGGLDSRLLAGFVSSLGHRPQCLTFGSRRDLDARCAAGVAQALSLPQSRHEVSFERYPEYAARSVAWEQLSGGLYALPLGWNLATETHAHAPDRIVCGLTLDAVIGGAKQVVSSDRPLAFEQLRPGALGFDRGELDRLVRSPALREACEEARADVTRAYWTSGDDDHHRAWAANLAHRHRFPVGACAWRYSFYAWPVLPALDRQLLALARGLAPELTARRRIQSTMLVRFFPRLAALDLDRNYFDTRPLAAAPEGPLRGLQRRLVKLGRRLRGWTGADARFYVRVMDLNSSGWRSVRAASEGARGRLSEFFDLRVLAGMLPGPHATARRRTDPIIHSTPLKNTIGLMAWLAEHT